MPRWLPTLIWSQGICHGVNYFQFTRLYIEFVFVETKRFVVSNPKVILMRQTCGQHSRMSAGSKRRALSFYFSIQICYMFPISKCRGEWDLDLFTTLVLAKQMPLGSGNFRFKNLFGRKVCRNSPIRGGILFASTAVGHRPRSHSPLHYHIKNI